MQNDVLYRKQRVPRATPNHDHHSRQESNMLETFNLEKKTKPLLLWNDNTRPPKLPSAGEHRASVPHCWEQPWSLSRERERLRNGLSLLRGLTGPVMSPQPASRERNANGAACDPGRTGLCYYATGKPPLRSSERGREKWTSTLGLGSFSICYHFCVHCNMR